MERAVIGETTFFGGNGNEWLVWQSVLREMFVENAAENSKTRSAVVAQKTRPSVPDIALRFGPMPFMAFPARL